MVAPEPALAAAPGLLPLTRVRRITAERMAASARSVARVTLFAEVDVTELVRFREQLKDDFARRRGVRLTFDAIFIKAAAIALAEHATIRAQWADGALRPVDAVHVGFAVAAQDGLLVPVVRDADRRRLDEVCREVDRLAEKARAGRLEPADYGNGTFTITNLGSYGVDAFTPIVNPPETAILGVGRIARRPGVVDDRLEPRDQLWLALSFDHRVVDGAPAAEFLRRIREVLEKPYLLLA
jgi:pyruvate dehydrogenase E2 component (dihydrolipoamide acetyltransferase)